MQNKSPLFAMLLLTGVYLTAPAANALAESSKINVTYIGKGFANFEEDYTSLGSGNQCRVDHLNVRENIANAEWEVKWKKVKVQPILRKPPASAKFSALMNVAAESFADLSKCLGSLNDCKPQEPHCTLLASQCAEAKLANDDSYQPGLTITKQGKGYIVTIEAEKQLRGTAVPIPVPSPSPVEQSIGSNLTATQDPSLCLRSSIFDNAVVQGLKDTSISAVKIKLTPVEDKTASILGVKLQKHHDCTDPAKVLSGLQTHCTLVTDFTGTVLIGGKWKAKVVK